MNFNTLDFLFLFLPVVLLLFYTVPLRLRLPVLFLSSCIFYGVSGVVPLIFFLVSIAWGFLTAFVAEKYRTRWSVLLVAAFPLLVLYFFKYLDFTLTSVGADQPTRDHFYFFLSIVLPAGISFYTFEIISYGFDIADGKFPADRKFHPFAVHISFFPQLIAGPILRYEQIRDQLTRISTVRHLNPNFAAGLKYLSIGLFCKIFFADIPASLVEKDYELLVNSSSLDAAFSILVYSFRIYYDFWAYSLMAIGLGKMFAIDLPVNFKEPYLASNPRDFWRRWHVTLSFWLRDYVYIRLKGNQHYIRNIIVVFVLCGLWHGAGWNFVIWGAYHAVLVVTYHLSKSLWDRLPRPLAVGLNFSLVTLGWPLFYSSIGEYFILLGKLFAVSTAFTASHVFGVKEWLFLALVGLFTFTMREKTWLYNERFNWVFDFPAVHAGLALLSIMFVEYAKTFIYFRF